MASLMIWVNIGSGNGLLPNGSHSIDYERYRGCHLCYLPWVWMSTNGAISVSRWLDNKLGLTSFQFEKSIQNRMICRNAYIFNAQKPTGEKTKEKILHASFISISPPIPEIWLLQNFTLRIKSQGHGCGQRFRSHSKASTQSIYFDFI